MKRVRKYFGQNGNMLFLSALLIAISAASYSQADRKLIREGNREYGKEKYSESEISYRKAIDKNKESADAVFNTGDALYRQKKYEDAGKQFLQNHDMNDDKKRKSASLYNLGNSLLMANKVQESIDAYKGSLKLDPDNLETKYNLAYAQDLLKQQQEQQQQQQQQNNQDKKDQDNNKEDKNQDQQDKKDQEQQEQSNSNNNREFRRKTPNDCLMPWRMMKKIYRKRLNLQKHRKHVSGPLKTGNLNGRP